MDNELKKFRDGDLFKEILIRYKERKVTKSEIKSRYGDIIIKPYYTEEEKKALED